MESGSKTKIMEFSRLIGVLKHLPRTGWVKKGVSNPETISGHMYRMSMLAFLLDKDEVDRDKCIRMSLVHDVAECIAGDITPQCGVSEDDKFEKEKKGIEKLASLVGPEVGGEFMSLWLEYEAQETVEAKTVKDLDKFDMISQAFEYEEDAKSPGMLQEFFDTTPMALFNNSTVLEWVKELSDKRFDSAKVLVQEVAQSADKRMFADEN